MVVSQFKLSCAAIWDEAITHGSWCLASLPWCLFRLACGKIQSDIITGLC